MSIIDWRPYVFDLIKVNVLIVLHPDSSFWIGSKIVEIRTYTLICRQSERFTILKIRSEMSYGGNFGNLKMKITSMVENFLDQEIVLLPSNQVRDLTLIHQFSKMQIVHNLSVCISKAFECSESFLFLELHCWSLNHVGSRSRISSCFTGCFSIIYILSFKGLTIWKFNWVAFSL